MHAILYLDDEIDNLTAFKAVFRRYFQVYLAENAQQAFHILQTTSVDLVISDQRMPETTGVVFLEQVYALYPHTIRMILTGYSDMQAIIDAVNRGKIYYYIAKPWRFEDLKLILDNALETYTLRRKNADLEAEKMALTLKNLQQEKERIASHFEVLKNQINPHFLFNALNTLTALISTDQQSAVRFTTRFAKMYRNLLEYGNHQLISLTQELEMVDNYVYLQQIRFGTHLQLVKSVTQFQFSLPPFAIQLLVENAIKHNMITEECPLHIHIEQHDEAILVSNQIFLRPSNEHSTGIGLNNLRERYRLLTGRAVDYQVDNGWFKVSIPLIPDA